MGRNRRLDVILQPARRRSIGPRDPLTDVVASSEPLSAGTGDRRAYRKQALAEKLGVSDQQLRKYEADVNRIGAAPPWRVAEILKIPVGKLL